MCAEEPGLGAGGHPGLEPAQRRLGQFSRRFERIALIIASYTRASRPGFKSTAPPSRKEREKDRAPDFGCGEGMGQPRFLLPPFPQKDAERVGHPTVACDLELHLERLRTRPHRRGYPQNPSLG